MSLIGTQVGHRSYAEMEAILKNTEEEVAFTFGTQDTHLTIVVSYDHGMYNATTLCNGDEYFHYYESMQVLFKAQPFDLARFDVVERISVINVDLS